VAQPGQTIRNPATGETLTFVVTSGESGGRLLQVDVAAEPGKQGPPLHVHRAFVERYEIRSGRVAIALHGSTRVLAEGDRLEIPRGAAHTFRVEGDEPVRMVVDFEPAGTYESFLETMYGLAEEGKTDGQGRPSLLRMAVIGRAHLEDFALARPPYWVQKVLFAVLAPLGRLRGYRAAPGGS
jgi:mannose-6-phosphate isomerase-like protein (cupin superfamily)